MNEGRPHCVVIIFRIKHVTKGTRESRAALLIRRLGHGLAGQEPRYKVGSHVAQILGMEKGETSTAVMSNMLCQPHE